MAAALWNCRNRFHRMSPFIWHKNRTIVMNCSIRVVRRAQSMTNWRYFVQANATHWLKRMTIWWMCGARVVLALHCIEWIVRDKWRAICERPHANVNSTAERDSFMRPVFLSSTISLNCMKFAMTVQRHQHYTHIIKSMGAQSNVSIRWMHAGTQSTLYLPATNASVQIDRTQIEMFMHVFSIFMS